MFKSKLHFIWLTDKYITSSFSVLLFPKAEWHWEGWDTRTVVWLYVVQKKDVLFILSVVYCFINDPLVYKYTILVFIGFAYLLVRNSFPLQFLLNSGKKKSLKGAWKFNSLWLSTSNHSEMKKQLIYEHLSLFCLIWSFCSPEWLLTASHQHRLLQSWQPSTVLPDDLSFNLILWKAAGYSSSTSYLQ